MYSFRQNFAWTTPPQSFLLGLQSHSKKSAIKNQINEFAAEVDLIEQDYLDSARKAF